MSGNEFETYVREKLQYINGELGKAIKNTETLLISTEIMKTDISWLKKLFSYIAIVLSGIIVGVIIEFVKTN